MATLALTTGIAACGQTQAGPGHSVSGAAIQFVGNDTCPTKGQQPYDAPSPPKVNSVPPVGQAIDEMPHSHVELPAHVTYNHDPPTSGCHYNLGYGSAPIQTGAYDKVVAPEYWVHNLEHGYIVVLYNCPSGCATQFQQLRTWYRSLPADPSGAVTYSKVLILPWPTMTVPFAAVSWDWYDPIPIFSIDEVQRFYANHVGQGAEPNAP
ncbi:MAG: DUF3105 domain-containing protein [Chloroflexi bacterium]|nr:MAG: DUF3105 domain-containing protein [Chloroflexota bacterium]